ncbi:MAG: hypothetical protein ABSB95_09815 [Dissulfurispiraceae bacterium]
MELTILYIISSIVIAVFGRHRKFGFWGFLFCSLLLTPVIGFIVLLASDSRKPGPVLKKNN